jgi:hypothetical protein
VIPANFRSTLRYQCKSDPATLIADLEELAKRSLTATNRRRIAFVALVAGAAGGILVSVLGHSVLWHVTGGVLTAVGVVLIVVFIERVSRWIIDVNRCKLAAAVVRGLACDLPPNGKLDATVDFNAYTSKQYRTETSSPAGNGASAYRQGWLAVAGVLADGTHLALSSDLVARRKERRKSKGRMKVKEDLCQHVALTLRVRSLPVSAPTRWPELVRSRPMPPGVRVHRAGVKEDRLTLEVRTQRHVRITNKGIVVTGRDIEERVASRHAVLAPMLAAYHALHACRAGG